MNVRFAEDSICVNDFSWREYHNLFRVKFILILSRLFFIFFDTLTYLKQFVALGGRGEGCYTVIFSNIFYHKLDTRGNI